MAKKTSPEQQVTEVKVALCREITAEMNRLGWNQSDLARHFGCSRVVTSCIARGVTENFSIQKLLSYGQTLDLGVKVSVT